MTTNLSSDSMIAKAAIWLCIVVMGFLLAGALGDVASNTKAVIDLKQNQVILIERMNNHMIVSEEALKNIQKTINVSQECLFKIQLNKKCT